MIIEIQCLPNPPGTPDNRYEHIEAALDLIIESGLKYEVGALGTTVEGEPDAVWALARRAHEACLHAGANGLVTVLKVEQAVVDAPTVESLTSKFR